LQIQLCTTEVSGTDTDQKGHVSSFSDSGFDHKSNHKVLLHNSTSNQQPIYSTFQNGPVSCPRQWGMWGGGRANIAISSYGLQFP